VALSAETGYGIGKLMPAILKTHTDWSTKVKTRDLNDWLAMAIQRHPPPAVGGKRIKPKYMAQTKARPPTFVLFSSRAEQMPEQYRRYLVNSLRESFDMPGVPIRVSLKSNKNPYAEGGAKSGAPSFQQGGEAKKEKAMSLAAEARAEKAAATAEAAGEPAPKPVKKTVVKLTGVKAAKARAATALKFTKAKGAKGSRPGIQKLRGGGSVKGRPPRPTTRTGKK
jgi:GTP-binding protein